jgi:hypothetical protein
VGRAEVIYTRGLSPGSLLIFLVLVCATSVARDTPHLSPAAVVDSARQILTFVEARGFEYQSSSRTELQLEGLVPSSRRRLVLVLVFEFNDTHEGPP